MSEPNTDISGKGRVVVGVDGSDGSRAALDYALDEAGWRDLSVQAVIAWEPPDLWVTSEGLVAPGNELQRAARAEATAVVESVVSARAERGASSPQVGVEVHSGPAAVVLERLSGDAELLVVGHRGRGGVASRLIGSVGLSCVVHAACSVIVVRS